MAKAANGSAPVYSVLRFAQALCVVPPGVELRHTNQIPHSTNKGVMEPMGVGVRRGGGGSEPVVAQANG